MFKQLAKKFLLTIFLGTFLVSTTCKPVNDQFSDDMVNMIRSLDAITIVILAASATILGKVSITRPDVIKKYAPLIAIPIALRGPRALPGFAAFFIMGYVA